MVQRSAVSALSRVWAFIEENGVNVAEMPYEVIAELQVARGLVPILVHNADRAPGKLAYMSDSSGEGYALIEARVEASEIWTAGHSQERWRFRQQHEARDGPWEVAAASESPSCPMLGGQYTEWMKFMTDSHDFEKPLVPFMKKSHYDWNKGALFEDDAGFLPPVPEDLFEEGRWSRVVCGAWRRPEAIHNKECRASILGLRRSARKQSC